jgi:hypothetical protein
MAKVEAKDPYKVYKVWACAGLGALVVLLVGYLVYRSFNRGFQGREVTSAEANIQKIGDCSITGGSHPVRPGVK